MIVETDRLRLRPWEETDAQQLYQYASDPRVGPAAGWLPHTSVEESREIIRTVLSLPGTLAVEIKGLPGPVGAVGLIRNNQQNEYMQPDEVEIGYWLGVPFWGQGYIPEAVEAMLSIAFVHLRCPAVWCGYYDGNVKSRRCQTKCGFRPHHSCPDVFVEKLGETRTLHFTRLTREEWEERDYAE